MIKAGSQFIILYMIIKSGNYFWNKHNFNCFTKYDNPENYPPCIINYIGSSRRIFYVYRLFTIFFKTTNLKLFFTKVFVFIKCFKQLLLFKNGFIRKRVFKEKSFKTVLLLWNQYNKIPNDCLVLFIYYYGNTVMWAWFQYLAF